MFQPINSSGENVDGDPAIIISLPKYARRDDTAHNIPASLNATAPMVLAMPTVATSFTDTSTWRDGIEVETKAPEGDAADGDEQTSGRKKATTRHPGTLAPEMVSTFPLPLPRSLAQVFPPVPRMHQVLSWLPGLCVHS